MPRQWTEMMTAHRAAVRDTVLDTAAALAAEHGPAAVTMTQIAEQAGITRATLYKYFPDVQAILAAWHQRNIGRHLDELTEIAATSGTPAQRLQAVLEAYAARITHRRPHDSELAALLHRGEHVAAAQQRLRGFLAALIAEAAEVGEVRDDVAAEELAGYCLHALTAVGTEPSPDAAGRLVTVTMAGLRPPG